MAAFILSFSCLTWKLFCQGSHFTTMNKPVGEHGWEYSPESGNQRSSEAVAVHCHPGHTAARHVPYLGTVSQDDP